MATCSSTTVRWPHNRERPPLSWSRRRMNFAITHKTKGDEEKVASAIKRLAEEDPTLSLWRDPQTGEEILRQFSQMHVEVALESAKERDPVDVELHHAARAGPSTIRSEAREQYENC